ncbi:alpha/beta hydrolase [Salipiger abyssi]|uniref:alpha/beta hydrolase n=1 Tax=Salipiger abyssi TaxID=1250539 RepID=UPI001A907CDD|nr:hypothetical protein [Salipiger abyssi]MBN9889249.1 hypothetical protein [Salipiger abyssi]
MNHVANNRSIPAEPMAADASDAPAAAEEAFGFDLDTRAPDRSGLRTLLKSARHNALLLASRVAPAVTASLLARRYLKSATFVGPVQRRTRRGVSFFQAAPDVAVIRHQPQGVRRGRVLLVHGHDGNVRQFARLARALRNAGAEVDALILPGHLDPAREICSVATVTRAIRHCAETLGPYDGMLGHCVSANGLLFALDEGITSPRVVFVSTPIELHKLIRLAGTQYGIANGCLDRFVQAVSRLGVPYPVDLPWQPLAARRGEKLLAVHARHDYAAPVKDLDALGRIWPDAHVEVFEQGDHNSILHMNAPIKAITEFLSADFSEPVGDDRAAPQAMPNPS